MSREQQVREAIDRLVAGVRRDVDGRLETLAADLLHIVRQDAQASRVDLERTAIDVARTVALGGSQARQDLMSRVAMAVRRLDESSTLRSILGVLADGAATEAARVAVLLVDGDELRAYRQHGFDPGAGPVDLPRQAAPVLAAVVNLRQSTPVPPSAAADPATPAFMRVPVGQLGLILPVVVGRAVAAIVYVQGPDDRSRLTGPPVWTEQVEVLVRHAAARLEAVTSQRTVEVLTHSS
jgi:hypothetical protein